MKILTFADTSSTSPYDREPLFLTDASLLTGGKPQFLPDLSHDYTIRAGMALVLRNTGKKIAPRFIHRYCEWLAPVALLTDETELYRCRSRGLPYTRAVAFDYSLARGPLMPFSETMADTWLMTLEADDTSESLSAVMTAPQWRENLAELSRIVTFRTGDIIIPSLGNPVPVMKDMNIKLTVINPQISTSNVIYDYNIK